MGLFSRKHSSRPGRVVRAKLNKEDHESFKLRSTNVNTPVLLAVNEAQPFEQAADTFLRNKSLILCSNGNVMKDVFGKNIDQPDISNPTRSRDERPLDTIRGFEYAISGDPQWIDMLETPRYGFNVRPDFSLTGAGVPFQNADELREADHVPVAWNNYVIPDGMYNRYGR